MSHYLEGINRIRKLCYSNQDQLDRVIGAKKYMDSHFDEALNLDHLSQDQALSKYHLHRLFKRYYGLTPRQYLIEKRIEEAKGLLKQGKSISDTCFAVGFESPSSFSLLFKRKTGYTPRAYRKKSYEKRKIR